MNAIFLKFCVQICLLCYQPSLVHCFFINLVESVFLLNQLYCGYGQVLRRASFHLKSELSFYWQISTRGHLATLMVLNIRHQEGSPWVCYWMLWVPCVHLRWWAILEPVGSENLLGLAFCGASRVPLPPRKQNKFHCFAVSHGQSATAESFLNRHNSSLLRNRLWESIRSQLSSRCIGVLRARNSPAHQAGRRSPFKEILHYSKQDSQFQFSLAIGYFRTHHQKRNVVLVLLQLCEA